MVGNDRPTGLRGVPAFICVHRPTSRRPRLVQIVGLRHPGRGDYFSDHLPNLNHKDASLHLRGKWLIEVAELRAYSRAAIDEFKEFLVRDIDRYRPP